MNEILRIILIGTMPLEMLLLCRKICP